MKTAHIEKVVASRKVKDIEKNGIKQFRDPNNWTVG